MLPTQFRLRSLVSVVAVAALSMACLQSWRKAQGAPMRPSFRIASAILTTRRAQQSQKTTTVIDPLPPAAFLVASLAFGRLSRRSSRNRRPHPTT